MNLIRKEKLSFVYEIDCRVVHVLRRDARSKVLLGQDKSRPQRYQQEHEMLHKASFKDTKSPLVMKIWCQINDSRRDASYHNEVGRNFDGVKNFDSG